MIPSTMESTKRNKSLKNGLIKATLVERFFSVEVNEDGRKIYKKFSMRDDVYRKKCSKMGTFKGGISSDK